MQVDLCEMAVRFGNRFLEPVDEGREVQATVHAVVTQLQEIESALPSLNAAYV